MVSRTLTFKSADALQAWGRRLARRLRPTDVVALIGPLGAGKTTLVQSIAEVWGYRRGANSPTFALANEYPTPRGVVYHMDMYRLSPRERDAFPLEEYWGHGLCLVEWADRVRDRWPENTLEIVFTIPSAETRRLSLPRPNPAWQKRLRTGSPPLF
jgi:tRNA threonylcarbamoyladenosine biosynthesis protein TsaE